MGGFVRVLVGWLAGCAGPGTSDGEDAGADTSGDTDADADTDTDADTNYGSTTETICSSGLGVRDVDIVPHDGVGHVT